MSEDSTAPVVLADAVAMIHELDLAGIIFYKVSATFDDATDQTPEQDEEKYPLTISTAWRVQTNGADFRLGVEVPYPQGLIEVDAAVAYRSEREVELNDDALLEFADNVALMALFPYVRQAVHDLGARVGNPAMLPILPRGAISYRANVDSPPENDQH